MNRGNTYLGSISRWYWQVRMSHLCLRSSFWIVYQMSWGFSFTGLVSTKTPTNPRSVPIDKRRNRSVGPEDFLPYIHNSSVESLSSLSYRVRCKWCEDRRLKSQTPLFQLLQISLTISLKEEFQTFYYCFLKNSNCRGAGHEWQRSV